MLFEEWTDPTCDTADETMMISDRKKDQRHRWHHRPCWHYTFLQCARGITLGFCNFERWLICDTRFVLIIGRHKGIHKAENLIRYVDTRKKVRASRSAFHSLMSALCSLFPEESTVQRCYCLFDSSSEPFNAYSLDEQILS